MQLSAHTLFSAFHHAQTVGETVVQCTMSPLWAQISPLLEIIFSQPVYAGLIVGAVLGAERVSAMKASPQPRRYDGAEPPPPHPPAP